MIYHYNKLVRDKIPTEVNTKEGRKANWRILKEEEYIEQLDKKLLEEVHEFIEAHDEEELADVIEVIEAIVKAKNIKIEEVREKQKRKRERKGSFNNRVYLEFVEESKRNIEEEKELNKQWRNGRIDSER